jgi:hypothetical protein
MADETKKYIIEIESNLQEYANIASKATIEEKTIQKNMKRIERKYLY